MDPSVTAEAIIVGGKADLICPFLVQRDLAAGIGAVGMEIENKQLFTLPEAKHLAVIIQIQDLLMQGGKYRMNVPGQAAGCWEYKVPKSYMKLAKKTLSLL